MPSHSSRLTQGRVTYRKVTLQGTYTLDSNGNPFIMSMDGQGLQFKVTLVYLPASVQLSDLQQGQVWWIDNATSVATWSLYKSVDGYTPSPSSATVAAIGNILMPVGFIYHSGGASAFTTPTALQTALGFGTWEAYSPGQSLIGVGTYSDGTTSETITNGQQLGDYKVQLTVGEGTVESHTHGVTDEGHEHVTLGWSNADPSYGLEGGSGFYAGGIAVNGSDVDTSGPTGTPIVSINTPTTANATSAHNNIHPVLGTYMYIRTT
jgi:hypothetical protein